MSVSTLSTNAWQEVQPPGIIPNSGNAHLRLADADIIKEELQRPEKPRGQLNIPGLSHIPEFDPTISIVGDIATFNINLSYPWPSIEIECSFSEQKIIDFALRLADSSVDAWLLHTRINLVLAEAGKFSYRLADFDEILMAKFDLLSDSEKKTLLQLAKLSRKLKFIEESFNVKFAIPDIISSDDLANIEIVFRGITEGEFTIRNGGITFLEVSPPDIDLTKSPFNEPGEFSCNIGNTIQLLGRELSVGPITVHLNKAEPADLRVIEQIRKDPTQPVNLRFEVLDNQITYCFESYASKSRKHRMRRLNCFKYELAREEPEELVALVDDPLQGDVSSEEANQIAMGWTQYYDLPDRYCPQEPELDEAAGQWRVPIWLVYTSGKGGQVGQIIIDSKTGVIVSHTPIEELRSKGRALAETILHVG